LENGRTGKGTCVAAGRPKPREVTALLTALDDSFRQHLHQRLLEADCEDVRVVDPQGEFAPLLFECEDAVVILGGRWPDLRPFLRMAVRARAPAILVLQQIASTAASDEGAREALRIGARAVLSAEVSTSAIKAALAASRAGLIVLDSTLKAGRELLNSDEPPHQRSHRTRPQLTTRERKILSLIAGGVSNKGIARSLGVSVNTVKFHLAATFQKLNAATRAEAVAEGIRRGELSL
jgi:DNA-binding NarL/FixJ family response regulator